MERRIQAALEKLVEGRTVIAIAHRLSTVQRANQILVVQQGRIVERGTHETLFTAGGRYWSLLRRQQLEESLEEESPSLAEHASDGTIEP